MASRAFPSPHPTTVDLIFRSLVFVHAVCHICAVDDVLESAADNLLIAGGIRRTRRGNAILPWRQVLLFPNQTVSGPNPKG
jgi:hypothetical protein